MTQTLPRTAILMANAVAFIAPKSFQRRAASAFVTPRAKRQSERGRDFLETLSREEFEGPHGRQRAYAGGTGRTVFFQHGWEADSADLASHARRLHGEGFRVVLIDGPSHGESEGRKATLKDFAAGIGAAKDAFGQPYAMVAHSMGGPASVIAMARHGFAPDRFVSLGAPRSLPENVEFQGRSMGLSKRAVRLMLAAIERKLGEPIGHFDVCRDAPSLSARALFIHGTGDQIVPADAARKMAVVWQGSELDLREGLGHRGVLRDQTVIERVADFLA